MIGSLNGILNYRAADSLIVDVGGVGYKISVSQRTFAKLPPSGEKVFLFVYTAVREDDIVLFGFIDEGEKKLFQRLISVNGIGPKLALTILSGILPHDLVEALHREDLARLTAIPGIGKKTAERMILDLKDKLTEFLGDGYLKEAAGSVGSGKRKIFEEAVSALINLGYTRGIAERTISQVSPQEGQPLESAIRHALKLLSEARND